MGDDVRTDETTETTQTDTNEEVTVAEEEPATSAESLDSKLDRIETTIADLSALVSSVVNTFASRSVDDGAVVVSDTTEADEPEIVDEEPVSPYDRDYLI